MTSQLLQTLIDTLKPLGAKKLVLALSGGLDSMVLLELCAELKAHQSFDVEAVYVHHGLSPYATDWGQFCKQECAKRGILFQQVKVNLSKAGNIEAQAREARYDALAKWVTLPSTALLTAHHADDQLESLLLALKRGSGAAGLSGIGLRQPFASGMLVRPLLPFSREELECFARGKNLSFVLDDSNQSTEYDRNFLRLEIIPRLQARWPSFRANALRSQQHVRELAQWQQEQIEPLLAKVLEGDELIIASLMSFSEVEQALLVRRWLLRWQLNPSSSWLETFFSELLAAKPDAQPILVLETYQVRRFAGRVYVLLPPKKPEVMCQVWDGSLLELPLGLGVLSVQSVEAPGAVPVRLLAGQALTLCFGQYNWPFLPSTERQHKPLKQWFKLWQFPPWQRSQYPVLLQNGQVVAVAGVIGNAKAQSANAWLVWQNIES